MLLNKIHNRKIIYSHIHTISFRGIDTISVSVQVHLSNGLLAMAIVGLADKAVDECLVLGKLSLDGSI
jgi:magnesium chelatase family protein